MPDTTTSLVKPLFDGVIAGDAFAAVGEVKGDEERAIRAFLDATRVALEAEERERGGDAPSGLPREEPLTRELAQTLGAAGVLGAAIPSEYGGGGLSHAGSTALCKGTRRHRPGAGRVRHRS